MVIEQMAVEDSRVLDMIAELDQYQLDLYGEDCNNLESPEEMVQNGSYLLGAVQDDVLLGIGSIKLCEDYAEIKRMFFDKKARGTGAAIRLISELENYAKEAGMKQVYLETGYLQLAAINFYQKAGYQVVGAFGDYPADDKVSVFMGKAI